MACRAHVDAAPDGLAATSVVDGRARVVALSVLVGVAVAVAFAAVVYVRDGAALRWLAARPGRRARVTGGALLAAGTFTFVYWVLRVPAIFGYGWFPRMPWN